MANTKNVTDRAERKKLKRGQRKALKEVLGGLTPKDVKKWRKSEVKGLRAFVAQKEKAD
jgi:hypothetical protein